MHERPFVGNGTASSDNAVLFRIGPRRSSIDLFRRGQDLSVRFGGRTYHFNLSGSSPAIERLRECVTEHRNATKETVAAPQEDRRLMVLDTAVLSNNIAVRAGVSGFQLITTEEHTKMLGSPDAMWRTGALVGFLNIHEKASGLTPDEAADRIGEKRGFCSDVMNSATRAEQVNSTTVMIVGTQCRNTARVPYLITTIVVRRSRGGYFEYQ
ncbi:MAG: hypothetical protein OEU46_24225, partial [Alphaproteobacteria bacterium]|nr:hypothetical protein [Alphaproteobacteria bacterium]